jgi:hypothetical protein
MSRQPSESNPAEQGGNDNDGEPQRTIRDAGENVEPLSILDMMNTAGLSTILPVTQCKDPEEEKRQIEINLQQSPLAEYNPQIHDRKLSPLPTPSTHNYVPLQYPVVNTNADENRRILHGYKRRWEGFSNNQKTLNAKYNSIELATKVPFSPEFISKIGKDNARNIQDIQDIDNERIKQQIVEGFVEYEAGRHYNTQKEELMKFLHLRDHITSIKFDYTNDRFKWKIDKEEGTGFVSFTKRRLNIPRLDAVATLASLVKVKPDYIFNIYDAPHVSETEGKIHRQEDIPRYIQIENDNRIMHFKKIHYIYGFGRQVIGAIIEYQLEDITICLPAAVGNGTLCIGRYQASAHLFNQGMIDDNVSAEILFCQDIRLAIKLDNLFSEAKIPNNSFIVTGHFGTDTSVIPWNFFNQRNVTFLCAPSKECFALVKEYQSKILGGGAQSFKVYPFPLLHSPTGKLREDKDRYMTDATEAKLLKEVTYLDDVERPSYLVQKILEKSMTYKDYIVWGREYLLFKPRGDGNKEQIATLPQAGRLDDTSIESIKTDNSSHVIDELIT